MEFVLTGFRQESNVRRYAFDAVSATHVRTHVTVSADLSLARKYRIPLQELPLLCRRLLESLTEAPKPGSIPELIRDGLMYTEKEMLGYAKNRAAAEDLAEQKRRAHRVPVSRRTSTRPAAAKTATLKD
jgi:hypothetical protein